VSGPSDVLKWASSERNRQQFSVESLALSDSKEWSLLNGRIVHESGRFFEVRGMEWVDARRDFVCSPFILQPEVGILGVMLMDRDGETRVLFDAKFEPGNVHGVDIAPCFQATKSNFEQAHGGAAPALSEIFLSEENWHTHVRQSEQGTRFLRKWNENVVVIADDDVEISQSMRWCTLPELSLLLRTSHMLNTDARSVIATSDWKLWFSPEEPPPLPHESRFSLALRKALVMPIQTNLEETASQLLAKWAEDHTFDSLEVPLVSAPQGLRVDSSATVGDIGISHHQVSADSRERASWDQPLIGGTRASQEVLLCTIRDGVPHFCFSPVSEIGLERPQFGNSISTFDPARSQQLDYSDSTSSRLINSSALMCSITQSDEGGRFNRQVVTYSIRFLGDSEPLAEMGSDAIWFSVSEVAHLSRLPGYFTNEARTTISLIVGLL
jgi:oxidase EvaA